jgi:hypothetical protein
MVSYRFGPMGVIVILLYACNGCLYPLAMHANKASGCIVESLSLPRLTDPLVDGHSTERRNRVATILYLLLAPSVKQRNFYITGISTSCFIRALHASGGYWTTIPSCTPSISNESTACVVLDLRWISASPPRRRRASCSKLMSHVELSPLCRM